MSIAHLTVLQSEQCLVGVSLRSGALVLSLSQILGGSVLVALGGLDGCDVVVIEGKSRAQIEREQQAEWETMSIEEHMAHYESQGIDRKEAMKLVAKDRGVSKRDIYQSLLS